MEFFYSKYIILYNALCAKVMELKMKDNVFYNFLPAKITHIFKYNSTSS